MRKVLMEKDGLRHVQYRQASRWIRIDTIWITERHQLWDYADKYCIEEDGKAPVAVFRHDNRLYAVAQFMILNYPMCDGCIQLEEGIQLVAYDATSPYNPYLAELDGAGEHIRLWTQERK